VAYLRFASVYKSFESAEAFEEEIAMLRAERSVQASAAEEPADAAPGVPGQPVSTRTG
jgi:transcriptional repressor NrdR